MKVYCNGNLVAHTDATGLPGDPNAYVYGPLFPMPNGDIHIGTRGHNWAMWSGYLDDFQVYDYALSAGEVAYLATDGTQCICIPLPQDADKANLKKSGSMCNEIIDFQDFAVMGQQWHTQILWP
jgi:hypothetical protein